MKKRLYKSENYKLSKWSGGNTRELAIYPSGADYLDRDFLWRLSSADSDKEESSFTKLPDYERILMVLDGSVVLAHGEERTASLATWEQDTFDGAVKTKCFGQLKKDYNLIYRKGTSGRMELIELTEQAKHIESQFEGSRFFGVYCAEGYTVVSAAGQTDMVKEDQQMVYELEPGEDVSLSVMGQGKCILTEVAFDKEKVLSFGMGYAAFDGYEIPGTGEAAGSDGAAGDSAVAAGAGAAGDAGAGAAGAAGAGRAAGAAGAGAGSAAGAGASDFMLALKLSLSNNRWSNAMSRMKKKGMLHSPMLEKKLRILDKYFVTGIVWSIGIIICLLLVPAGVNPAIVFGLVIAFSVVDVFLISPLIYMLYLPKPISAHIKRAEDLNAYERKVFEEQLNYDPRREKLMHKYRDRSGETYKGAADFWKKMSK